MYSRHFRWLRMKYSNDPHSIKISKKWVGMISFFIINSMIYPSWRSCCLDPQTMNPTCTNLISRDTCILGQHIPVPHSRIGLSIESNKMHSISWLEAFVFPPSIGTPNEGAHWDLCMRERTRENKRQWYSIILNYTGWWHDGETNTLYRPLVQILS